MSSTLSRRTATRLAASLVLAGAGATLLPGCAPLAVGGAVVGTTMVAIDRRTAAAQLEDETIEIKGSMRAREAGGEAAHITVTSYNRLVLITGEVPTDAVKRTVEQAVARVETYLATFGQERRKEVGKTLQDIGLALLREERNRVDIVQKAIRPREITFPQFKYMIPASAVLLTGLYVLILFIRELLDQRVKYPSDMAAMRGSIPMSYMAWKASSGTS